MEPQDLGLILVSTGLMALIFDVAGFLLLLGYRRNR